MNQIKISVVIPTYNEISVLPNCLESLKRQTVYGQMEIIVIDDGSTDYTKSKVKSQKSKVILLEQSHKGPGEARNLGASKAKGKILIFVDADMEFEPDFVEKLTKPILSGNVIGTFSKEEYLLNKDNSWARLWNVNLGRSPTKMEPRDFDTNKGALWNKLKTFVLKLEKDNLDASYTTDTAHVFRAILRTEFIKVGGFDPSKGYTDDWSLSQKLGVLAVAAPGAKYYHQNPDTLKEVWVQARWYGKNEFLTKNLIRKTYNLLRYCPFWALARIFDPKYFIFTLVYNSAVFTSVLLSFFGEAKSK